MVILTKRWDTTAAAFVYPLAHHFPAVGFLGFSGYLGLLGLTLNKSSQVQVST